MPTPAHPLTAEILALVAEGLHDPQIAARLGLTPAAVRGVRRRAGVRGNPRHGRPRTDRDDTTRGET